MAFIQKWQIEAKPTWHYFEVKINWFEPKEKRSYKGKAHDLKNQDASQGSTQGFNLFQMSPNWFLGICTLDPPSKVGLTPSTFWAFGWLNWLVHEAHRLP
jgi:hypothetical protein